MYGYCVQGCSKGVVRSEGVSLFKNYHTTGKDDMNTASFI